MNTIPEVTMQEEYFTTGEKTKTDELLRMAKEELRKLVHEMRNALEPQALNMEYVEYNGRSMPACNIKDTVSKVTASPGKTFNFHTCPSACAKPP